MPNLFDSADSITKCHSLILVDDKERYFLSIYFADAASLNEEVFAQYIIYPRCF